MQLTLATKHLDQVDQIGMLQLLKKNNSVVMSQLTTVMHYLEHLNLAHGYLFDERIVFCFEVLLDGH